MKRCLYIVLLCILLPSAMKAQETKDTVYQKKYERYLQLYGGDDSQAFMEASKQLKDYFLHHSEKSEEKRLDAYYKLMMNEVLYELENGRSYSAIKLANAMRLDMDERKVKMYNMVYASLGTIYESRGNYRMANHYFMDALKETAPTDTSSLMNIYSRLAFLKMTHDAADAWVWNEKFGALCGNLSLYYRIYLSNKATICLYLDKRQEFEQAYKLFHQQKMSINDGYGVTTMEIVKEAFDGNYEKALQLISSPSADFDELDRSDLRIRIYEMMGDQKQALKESERRRDLRDSLNSDMLFNNINEINAEMGLARINEKAVREREIWLAAVIVLLLIGLGLVASRYLQRRRYQKQLLKQNKELEIALSRAEESDRMKDSFIQHVSHEIRTPLNVITGYAQVITNPDYDLDDDVRTHMLHDISKNTVAITNIVNELLEVAQDESREYCRRDDTIRVNDFLRRMVDKAELQNKGRLAISFTTELDDDATIMSNRDTLEKIMDQLFSNAIKFTMEGSVNLSVSKSPDGGTTRFFITDTGIGIAKEDQERVFDQFYKVDSFKQGFGLGLTMSRKMAILLGGTLYLDKEYSDGARFILSLPTT